MGLGRWGLLNGLGTWGLEVEEEGLGRGCGGGVVGMECRGEGGGGAREGATSPWAPASTRGRPRSMAASMAW